MTLTDANREALDRSLEDSGCHGFIGDHGPLYAVVERIIAAREAEYIAKIEALATYCEKFAEPPWTPRGDSEGVVRRFYVHDDLRALIPADKEAQDD